MDSIIELLKARKPVIKKLMIGIYDYEYDMKKNITNDVYMTCHNVRVFLNLGVPTKYVRLSNILTIRKVFPVYEYIMENIGKDEDKKYFYEILEFLHSSFNIERF